MGERSGDKLADVRRGLVCLVQEGAKAEESLAEDGGFAEANCLTGSLEHSVEGGHVCPEEGETGGHVLEFAIEALEGFPRDDVAVGGQSSIQGGAVPTPFGLREAYSTARAREPAKPETDQGLVGGIGCVALGELGERDAIPPIEVTGDVRGREDGVSAVEAGPGGPQDKGGVGDVRGDGDAAHEVVHKDLEDKGEVVRQRRRAARDLRRGAGVFFQWVGLADAVGGEGDGHEADDEGDDDVGDLTEVRGAVGPAHLEGAREDYVNGFGRLARGEDIQEVGFQAPLHNHTPESVGQVEFRPVDRPFLWGVEHVLEKPWEDLAKMLNAGPLRGGDRGAIDGGLEGELGTPGTPGGAGRMDRSGEV